MEIKASSAPKIPIGFKNAIEDIAPDKALVVAPVNDPYPVSSTIEVHNLATAIQTIEELGK